MSAVGFLRRVFFQVAFLLEEGYSYKKIAEALIVSHNTVKTHVRQIYTKTGAAGRGELIHILRQNIPEE